MLTKIQSAKMKKYTVLICLFISVILFTAAAAIYPGGSFADNSSIGFDWTKNFISNLFEEKALNGQNNPSRIFALFGIGFHSLSYGIFFINMSKKMPDKHSALVLKMVGFFEIIFNFLIATSLHDSMVTISSTLSMLALFYITVYIIKTKRFFIKAFCIVSMLIFYYTLYLYGAGDWGLLAVMQKIALVCLLFLVITLEYFTTQNDFKKNP